MFEFERVGEESRDGNSFYNIKLDKVYTVKEFVNVVLERKNGDWGNIRIYREGVYVLDLPCCEYRYGKLITNLPKKVLNKKITKVTANGGWSVMDYLIYIEQ